MPPNFKFRKFEKHLQMMRWPVSGFLVVVVGGGGGGGVYVCGGIRCIGVGTPPIYEFFEPPIKPDAPMEHLPPPKNEAPPTEKCPSPIY